MDKNLLRFIDKFVTVQKPFLTLKSASEIADFVYDISCILFVAEYYQQKKYKDFNVFIKNLEFLAFFKKYNWILNILDSLSNQVKEDSRYFPGHKLDALGDIHNESNTRYRLKNKILSKNPADNSELIRRVALLLKDSKLTTVFPLSKTNPNGFIYRDFIDIGNDFENEKEVENYYKKYGEALSYLLLFRSIDNYYENMIISNKSPIFFDYECFFLNKTINSEQAPYSIYHTGTLKSSTHNNDSSSLTGGIQKMVSLLRPMIKGTLEAPQIVWENEKEALKNHLPFLKGKLVEPQKYTTFIKQGLTESSFNIQEHMAEIVEVAKETKITTRVIIRPTAFYKSLLVGYPYEYLQNKTTISDYLQRRLETHIPMLDIKLRKNFIKYEVNCLKLGFIPIFYQEIHSNDIFNSEKEIVAKFAESSFSLWEKQVKDYKHLIQDTLIQINLILGGN